MKKFTLIISAVLLTASAFATEPIAMLKGGRGGSDSKLSVGVSIGAGIPMGNYGKYDQPNTKDTTIYQAAAKTGFHWDLNVGYMFSDNIGAMLYIGGNSNSVDVAKIASVDSLPAGTVASTSYNVMQYMVGPMFAFPVSDEFAIKAKVLVGLMTVNYGTQTQGFGTIAITSTSAFGYGLGVGAEYKVSDLIGLGVNLDYLGSTQKVTEATITSPFGSGKSKTSRDMSTSLFNASLGINFHF